MSTKHGPPQGERTGEPSFVSQIREQLDALKGMFEATGADRDYSGIMNPQNAEWTALPADVRESLMDEYGWRPPAATTPEPAAPARREPIATAAPRQERREGKESRANREFLGYKLVREGEAFFIDEEYQERNNEGAYVPSVVRTSIAFPKPIAELMRSDAAYAEDMRRSCEDMRRELDKSTNLYFDDSPDDPNDLHPKWKFTLHGKVQEPHWPEVDSRPLREHLKDGIDPDAVPMDVFEQISAANTANNAVRQEVLETIRGSRPDLAESYEKARNKKAFLDAAIRDEGRNPELRPFKSRLQVYHNRKPYSVWVGLAKQAKRERVINAELQEMVAKPSVEADRPAKTEPVRSEAAPPKVAAASEKEGRKTLDQELATSREDARRLAADLFMKIGHAYPDAEKLARQVETFLPAVMEITYRERKTMPDAAKLGASELRAIVQDELRDRAEPGPDADDAIEVSPSQIVSEVGVDVETEENADPVYRALRERATKLRTPAELERFIEVLRKDGRPSAKKLSHEIALGQAGPLSEDRLTGLEREAGEERYFTDHPLLNKRNFQRTIDPETGESKIVIYLDRSDVDGALARAVRRLVLDAMFPGELAPRPTADQSATIEKVVAHLVGGKELGRRTGEVTIKKPDELPGLILKLAERLKMKQDQKKD